MAHTWKTELDLLSLAVRVASLPQETLHTMQKLVARLFEGENSGSETEEMIHISELRALQLTYESAIDHFDRDISQQLAEAELLGKELQALVDDAKQYEQELIDLRLRLHQHEAATLHEASLKEVAELKRKLDKNS